MGDIDAVSHRQAIRQLTVTSWVYVPDPVGRSTRFQWVLAVMPDAASPLLEQSYHRTSSVGQGSAWSLVIGQDFARCNIASNDTLADLERIEVQRQLRQTTEN